MDDSKSKKLSLDDLRKRLEGAAGKDLWRSFDDLADTPEFQQWVDDEFPHRSSLLEIDRRSLLKFMGASMAFASLAGCRSLVLGREKVVPYVKQPEDMVPGRPLFFRTAMPGPSYGLGLEVRSREGRPIKVEGNPDHPASLGSVDSYALASMLQFYDPDRSRTVMNAGETETWEGFVTALNKALKDSAGGAGFRLLTESVISPTLEAMIGQVKAKYPRMKWHQWQPLNRDIAHEATRMLYGKPLQPNFSLKEAAVVLSVDADFVSTPMPGSIRYARELMDGRRIEETGGRMNRHYAVGPMPTTNGAVADHFQPMTVAQMTSLLQEIVSGSGTTPFNRAVVDDLRGSGGACVVIPGEHLPADLYALCLKANEVLGALGRTLNFVEPLEEPASQIESLKNLTADMQAGQVQTILILGSNPVYNAPAALAFGEALKAVRNSFHCGLYYDETAMLCSWHAPEAHFLESWGDVRAYDGTTSIIQPLALPLHEGRSHIELLSLVAGRAGLGRDLVRKHWSRLDDKAWEEAVYNGIVPNTKRNYVTVQSVGSPQAAAPAQGFEIHFRPDPTIGDGSWVNNGWLQELPKPLTKIVWDNVVHVSPATAQSLGLHNTDNVVVTVGGKSVTAPVWIQPGHADNCATVYLGYGRWAGGRLALDDHGHPRGYNAYAIQPVDGRWSAPGQIAKGAGTAWIAVVQDHNVTEGRDIIRAGTLAEQSSNPNFSPHHGEKEEEVGTLYNTTKQWAEENPDLPQWGMSIDLNTCIGCNACVTACYAENNIPVVGKEQVLRGREMHWIRIDRYYGPRGGEGTLDNPVVYFQPMTCMHCENAPCEPVCPVGATVHSHEGLNQMVYNRCVGTRYCSNNCPYKVRRFNYLNFQYFQPNFSNDRDIPLLRMINNPEVTVRSRGVMEKCTYCVQRINAARIEAKKENRPIEDGEVVTACAQACPTRAITFGNIKDPNSAAAAKRNDKRTYMLLEELNTYPRTTYMGRVRNPNPQLEPATAEVKPEGGAH